MGLANILFQVSGISIHLPALDHSKTTLTTWLNYVNNSQTIELYRKVHADLFSSDKILINGVYMNMKLTFAPEAFYLLAPSEDTKLCIRILATPFFVTQHELKLLTHCFGNEM